MINRVEELKNDLNLLTMDEVMAVTGWSDNTVRDIMMYDKEFPVIKIGKHNQVRFEALKEYLSTRRVLRGKSKEEY